MNITPNLLLKMIELNRVSTFQVRLRNSYTAFANQVHIIKQNFEPASLYICITRRCLE